jgi:hypothetical protein
MAFGLAEPPANSPVTHLDGVEYPVDRESLVQVAADNGAPPDVINLFKSLPASSYESKEQVLRDLGEAARRFGLSNFDLDPENDRRDIGRDAFEGVDREGTTHL